MGKSAPKNKTKVVNLMGEYLLIKQCDKWQKLFLFTGINKSFLVISRNSIVKNKTVLKPTQVDKLSKLRRLS